MLLGSQALTNDPYFNNVSLLLSARDGLIKDYSKNNLSISNNGVTVSSTRVKWGNKSFYFNSNLGNYLSIQNSNLFQFGTGNFTIEGWFYLSLAGSFRGFFSIGQYTDGILLRHHSSGVDDFIACLSYYTWNSASYISINQWYYVSIIRNNNVVYIYVNGVQVFSVNYSNAINPTSLICIGANTHNLLREDHFWNGYISELRITKGIARPIQVPTQPFPNW